MGKIPARIELYRLLIEAAEPLFKLDGMGLEMACRQHAQNLMQYGIVKEECKTIEDALRVRLEEIEGQIFKHLNEGNQNNKAYSVSELKQYVKGDARYVLAANVVLEVVQVRRQLEAIVEAFQSMGWSLGHIVKLRVAQLEEVTL
jgi:hypothetical protein